MLPYNSYPVDRLSCNNLLFGPVNSVLNPFAPFSSKEHPLVETQYFASPRIVEFNASYPSPRQVEGWRMVVKRFASSLCSGTLLFLWITLKVTSFLQRNLHQFAVCKNIFHRDNLKHPIYMNILLPVNFRYKECLSLHLKYL